MKFLQGLSSAVRTLSILPCWEEDFPDMGLVLSWAPWVGFLLSALCAGPIMLVSLWICSWQNVAGTLLWSSLAAAFYVVTMAVLTRGFHLDGLADTFDGFGGGWEKDRILEIMRDSSIGSFGSIALISIFLLKFISLAILIYTSSWSSLWLSPVFSRLLIVWQAAKHNYARDSKSFAGNVISSTRKCHFFKALFHFIFIVLPFILLPYFLVREFYPLVILIAILMAGWGCCYFVGWLSERRIGGLTGDILGAMVELSEGTMFVVAAFISLMLLKSS